MLKIVGDIVKLYFTYTVVYTSIFSVSSYFYKSLLRRKAKGRNKIAVLVPVYREDAVIIQSMQHVQKQRYPKEYYDVFVVADSLGASTVRHLRNMGMQVVEVEFDHRTKNKSLYQGLKYINQLRDYEIVVILDADNVMDEKFLLYINEAYSLGYAAIQGKRTAKNKNNEIAILDGLSEAVNNTIFRKGHQALGLSVPVIGSGMAFSAKLLTTVFEQLDLDSFGDDKDLQLEILKRNHPIKYLEEAVVYDEKVDTYQAFDRQRKRWMFMQFVTLIESFPTSMRQLTKGNLSYFNVAFLAAIQLPRLLNVGFLITGLLALKLSKQDTSYWKNLVGIYFLSIAIAIPRSYYKKSTLTALTTLPRTFSVMLLSLLTARQASRQALHTVHSTEHDVKL